MASKTPKRPKPAEVGTVRLTVMRGPRADGRYYWRGRRKAERDLIWTGWATRDEAMAKVATLLAAGLPGSAASAALATPTTVEELVASWLEERKGQVWHGPWRERPRARGLLSPLSFKKYEICAGHLNAWIGDVPLGLVTGKLLASYVVSRRTRDSRPSKSDRTVANELGVLNFAWRWGRDRGWVSGSPPKVLDIDQDQYVNNRTTPTVPGVRAILPFLEGDSRLAVQLLAWAGARVIEITGKLDLCDIDLPADRITLHGKGGKKRTVPLPAALRPTLEERVRSGKPEDPLLVEEPGWLALRASSSRRIRTSTLRNRIKRACEQAGVPEFTPHGVRRLVVDQLYDADVDPGITAKTLGQCPEVALRNYRQVRPEKQHLAMLRAGLDTVLREPGDNVIHLPGSEDGALAWNLEAIPTELLEAELQRRALSAAVARDTMVAGGSQG